MGKSKQGSPAPINKKPSPSSADVSYNKTPNSNGSKNGLRSCSKTSCLKKKCCCSSRLFKLLILFFFSYLFYYTVNDVLCKAPRNRCPPSYLHLKNVVYPKYHSKVSPYLKTADHNYQLYLKPIQNKATVALKDISKPLIEKANLHLEKSVYSNEIYQKVSTRSKSIYNIANKFVKLEFHNLSIFIADDVIPFTEKTIIPSVKKGLAVSARYIRVGNKKVKEFIINSGPYKTHVAKHANVIYSNDYYKVFSTKLDHFWKSIEVLDANVKSKKQK